MTRRSAEVPREQGLVLEWRGSTPPPLSLTTHLSVHGVTLRTAHAGTVVPGRIANISRGAPRLASKALGLQGRRLGVLHPDPGAADALAQALRTRDAEVVVLSLDAHALGRLEALDPEVIVVEPRHFEGACWSVLARLFEHPLLRWASVLLAPSQPLIAAGGQAQDMQGLCAAVQLLCADYEAAALKARTQAALELALPTLGPVRVLRLLVQSGRSWRAQFESDALALEVDVAEGLIVGVRGGGARHEEPALLGAAGLGALLRAVDGVVRAQTVANPAVTNVMAPLADALAAALLSREPGSAPIAHGSVPTRPLRAPRQQTASRTLIGMQPAIPPVGAAVEPVLRGPPSMRDSTLTMPELAPAPAAQEDPAQPPASLNAEPAAQGAAAQGVAAQRSGSPSAEPAALPPPPAAAFALPPPAAAALARPVADASSTEARGAPVVAPVAPADETLRSVHPLAASRRTRLLKAGAAGVALTALAAWGGLAASSQRVEVARRAVAEPAAVAALERSEGTTVPAGAAAPVGSSERHAHEAPSAFADPPVRSDDVRALEGAENGPVRASARARPGALRAEKERPSEPKPNTPSVQKERPNEPKPSASSAEKGRPSESKLSEPKPSEPKPSGAMPARALPSAPAALAARARAALQQRDVATALQAARALSRQRPRWPQSQLLLGDAQALAGDAKRARASWKRAAQLGSAEANARLRGVSP